MQNTASIKQINITLCYRVEDTEDEEEEESIESSQVPEDEVIESSQLPEDSSAVKKRLEMAVILNTGYSRLPCLSGSVSLCVAHVGWL